MLPEDPEGVPDLVATRDRILDHLVGFVRSLRTAGADVPANAAVVAARALAAVGLGDRERARAALRAALVSRVEDEDAFEELFPAFWEGVSIEGPDEPVAPEQGAETPVPGFPVGPDADPDETAPAAPEAQADAVEAAVPSPAEDAGETAEVEAEAVTTAVYSPAGVPEPVGLDATRADADLARPVRRLTAAVAGLRGRRFTRSRTERIDARRALRRSFATGGTPVTLPERGRKEADVRATLLVDVSQSVLDTVDRGFLVSFLRLVRREWRSVRVFFFDTSLREVTDAFDAPTPAAALRALEDAEEAWGGGTRIGSALETVRREHPDAVDRDTAVFVISDGLEVGEIERLEEGMTWLSRRADATFWLNPLAASPDYEPTCRGMAAALPYVDGLFAFTGPEDISELARQLERRGPGEPLGYEFDPRRASG